jgi:hypothetical protein
LNILATLHKSTFSGEFYETVLAMPARRVAKFFVLVCLSTAVISGLAHLYYAMDAASGLAVETAEVLGGIELNNGVVDPHRPVPYIPDNTHVSRAFELVFSLPQSAALMPDSFVIVDTNAGSAARMSPNTLFLLTSQRLIVNPASKYSYDKSYSEMFGSLHLIVEKNSVHRFFMRWIVLLALFYCGWGAIANSVAFIMSVACIALVALAAYIFNFNRLRSVGDFFKIAFFAASPVYIGTNIVALSGTGIPWTWQVFILLSTFVMLRGVMRASRPFNRPDA